MPYTWHALLSLYGLTTLLLIPVVFMRRQEPAATLAWILGIVFLPFFGALVFVFFGIRFAGRGTHVARKANRKIRERAKDFRAHLLARHARDAKEGVPEHPVMKLARKLGDFPPTGGNQVVYSVEAHKTYALMEQAIREARDHIHLEFYIYLPDETGNRFADLLIAKAREGVKVRFIYDPVGSWDIQKGRAWRRRLIAEGIRVQSFILTRKIFRPWYLNLRNHRKLLIVDGKTAFTGGLNVASMFLSPPDQIGRWRDAMVRITGPAVAALQWVFIEDWHFATGETLLSEQYFPEVEECGPFILQILPSGPSDDCETAEMLFFNAVATAEKFVYLMTPYFVPDAAFRFALMSAALRGVDVRLLLPRQTDHTTVYLAGRSNYEELLNCGVKIYEFTGGVLHSKVAIADGPLTIVSSVNLDIRSFIFNFELSALIWGEEFANGVLTEFHGNLQRSIEIKLDKFKQRPMSVHIAESFCRLLSPLL